MDEEAQPSTFCPWQPKETPVIDHADCTWWRQAVVYQVYIRSFADHGRDGSRVPQPWSGAEPIRLPARDTALLASGPLDDGFLPPDTAIWLGR
jgi:hypothetical protein